MPTLLFWNISKGWNAETIALLLNKTLCDDGKEDQPPSEGSVRVKFLKLKRNNEDGQEHLLVASITFASKQERTEVECYQGLVIPHTHGYHLFDFTRADDEEEPKSSAHDSDCCAEESAKNIDNDYEVPVSNNSSAVSVPSPPLHLQLLAFPFEDLLDRYSNSQGPSWSPSYPPSLKILIDISSKLYKYNKKERLWTHASFAHALSKHLGARRAIVSLQGVPVPAKLANELLQMLQRIPAADQVDNLQKEKILSWPPASKQRKGVQSQHYLTIREQHPPCQEEIWSLCRQLFEITLQNTEKSDPLPPYSALAITKNFRGSPHVDNHDQTFQHVVSVGGFEGGQLCCELSDSEELQIDIHNRLGRIDGRKVHWVNGWEGLERYSVVYYSTRKSDFTPVVPQSEHVAWMNQSPELKNRK